jgi:DNA polymerase-3 subunit delta
VRAAKGSFERSVDQPGRDTRFYLFHGEDVAQSRALARRLLEALGAAKFDVAAAELKSNPAMLVDEAAAISLFGEARLIWIEPATNEISDAVEGLLSATNVENPVAAIAGKLSRASGLLKLAEASPRALAFTSYLPDAQDAARMVVDLGRQVGLKIGAAVAARIADSCGNDRAVASQELAKLALYLGADPHSPRELEHEALDAVGAESAEGDFLRLADLALAGDVDELVEELGHLPRGGAEAIPVIRSLQRRLLMLAPLRAKIKPGERADAVMASMGKSLFWKDKAKVQKMLANWTAEDLATVAERAGRLERDLMRPRARPDAGLPQRDALGEELIAIGRKARRR